MDDAVAALLSQWLQARLLPATAVGHPQLRPRPSGEPRQLRRVLSQVRRRLVLLRQASLAVLLRALPLY